MMDRETLYDENIKIKQEFNKLIDENKKFRADNLHLQVSISSIDSEKYKNMKRSLKNEIKPLRIRKPIENLSRSIKAKVMKKNRSH